MRPFEDRIFDHGGCIASLAILVFFCIVAYLAANNTSFNGVEQTFVVLFVAFIFLIMAVPFVIILLFLFVPLTIMLVNLITRITMFSGKAMFCTYKTSFKPIFFIACCSIMVDAAYRFGGGPSSAITMWLIATGFITGTICFFWLMIWLSDLAAMEVGRKPPEDHFRYF